MNGFPVLFEGLAAPLPLDNVDTDKILPAQFLKRITREGMGDGLFHSLRFASDGSAHPDFILNRSPWSNAEILVTGENFGCGSSREHAPWALRDFGIRVIIARGFADIFYNNCFKNGILPVRLDRSSVATLMAAAAVPSSARFVVRLPEQTVEISETGAVFGFDVDVQRKADLLAGADDISRTLQYSASIDSYERARSGSMPAISITQEVRDSWSAPAR